MAHKTPDSCSSSRRTSVSIPEFDFDLTPRRRARHEANAKMGLNAVANMLKDSCRSTNALPSMPPDPSLAQYSSVRRRLLSIVEHKSFEWTVTGCIILNTILMAIQHPRMNAAMERVSEIGNTVSVSQTLEQTTRIPFSAFACRYSQ
jgi:hypothetical protein